MNRQFERASALAERNAWHQADERGNSETGDEFRRPDCLVIISIPLFETFSIASQPPQCKTITQELRWRFILMEEEFWFFNSTFIASSDFHSMDTLLKWNVK
jgi:hypothetical protein